MNHYRCTFSYDGTNYQGWQIQPGNVPTIQKSILSSCQKIFNTEDIKIIGSGRTDTGVHAFAQVAKISVAKEIELDSFLKGLNSLLPEDIRLKHVELCNEDFHPVFSAKSKRYDYRFTVGHNSCPPHMRNLMATNTYSFDEELAHQVCKLYLGEHDFKNFMNKGTPVQSTVRTITNCSLRYIKSDPFWTSSHEGYWLFSVEGNGFLKQMVRLMVGALFSVARGHVSLDDLQSSLSGKTEVKIGPVATPNGLYLAQVEY